MEAPCFNVTMAWKHNCEASSSKQTHHTIITSSYTKKRKTFRFLFPLVPNKTVGSITQILKGTGIIPTILLHPRVSVHHGFSAKTGNIRATTRRGHNAVPSTAGVVVIYLSSCNNRKSGNKAIKRNKPSAGRLYLPGSSYASLTPPSAGGFSWAWPLTEVLNRPSRHISVPSSSCLLWEL